MNNNPIEHQRVMDDINRTNMATMDNATLDNFLNYLASGVLYTDGSLDYPQYVNYNDSGINREMAVIVIEEMGGREAFLAIYPTLIYNKCNYRFDLNLALLPEVFTNEELRRVFYARHRSNILDCATRQFLSTPAENITEWAAQCLDIHGNSETEIPEGEIKEVLCGGLLYRKSTQNRQTIERALVHILLDSLISQIADYFYFIKHGDNSGYIEYEENYHHIPDEWEDDG